jgi:hypothetical protein
MLPTQEKKRMRILRYIVAVSLFCGLTAAANAAAINFQVIVIDPPPSNLIQPITSDAFTFSFAPCVSPGQVPQGTSFVGCFTGENATGQTLTSLQMFIPTIPGLGVGCGPSGTGLDLFPTVTCTIVQGGYILDFTGGSIPTANGRSPDNAEFNRDSVFTIAEAGVDPSSFPEVTASFNSPIPAATPEPNSLMLLATGVLTGGGLMLGDRRRRIVAARSR